MNGRQQGGDALVAIPEDRLTVSGGVRPTIDWELGARATFAADQDDVPEGSEIAGLQVTVFRAGIDNVVDETYTIYPNGLNQPGRTFKISAAVTF